MGDINDEFTVNASNKKNKEVENFFKGYEFTKTDDDSLVEEFVNTHDGSDDYKQAIRSLIEAEVKHAMDEEIKKAKQELITEQRKAIIQIVEENRSIIRELVGEEKTAIWEKAAELRKSLLIHFSQELSNHNI